MTNPSQNHQSEPKGNNNIQHLVRGSLLLILAAWMSVGNIRFALYRLRAGTFGAWYIADTVLRLTAAAFFVWFGARAIRRAAEEVPRTRVGWGRLLLGITFIYANIRGHFAPTPGALQPTNASESAVMRIMTALIYLGGVALILAAFRKKKQNSAEILSEQSNLAAGQK